jgi:hypothetical protein
MIAYENRLSVVIKTSLQTRADFATPILQKCPLESIHRESLPTVRTAKGSENIAPYHELYHAPNDRYSIRPTWASSFIVDCLLDSEPEKRSQRAVPL